MGFEPQVMKILSQIRPDRQTVLFSATFPRAMEALAKKVLKKPLEITVGGRSVVAAEIEQIVEVREEETKFNRLLEILGRAYNDDPDSRTLIFVHRQESADNLLRDLLAKNYACMSLHGGKDQVDRDATISDFKAGIIPIVIATSVAARGLDVKLLKLVINFDCPNHMEDYVHRAGRTGRAGNKGTCVTFITPDQDKYAVDLQKALEASGVTVPPDLKALADCKSTEHVNTAPGSAILYSLRDRLTVCTLLSHTAFIEKIKSGKATAASSGFGGKGLDRLEQERESKERMQRSAYGEEEGAKKEGEEEGEGGEKGGVKKAGEGAGAAGEKTAATNGTPDFPDITVEVRRGPAPDSNRNKGHRRGGDGESGAQKEPGVVKINEQNLAALKAAEEAARQAGLDASGISKAQSVIAKLTASIQAKKQAQFGRKDQSEHHGHGGTGTPESEMEHARRRDPDATDYHAVVPINDYPQKARWKVTNKETMSTVSVKGAPHGCPVSGIGRPVSGIDRTPTDSAPRTFLGMSADAVFLPYRPVWLRLAWLHSFLPRAFACIPSTDPSSTKSRVPPSPTRASFTTRAKSQGPRTHRSSTCSSSPTTRCACVWPSRRSGVSSSTPLPSLWSRRAGIRRGVAEDGTLSCIEVR